MDEEDNVSNGGEGQRSSGWIGREVVGVTELLLSVLIVCDNFFFLLFCFFYIIMANGGKYSAFSF